ncbi:MAG: TolC family outer membrane protein [Shinella sp.]|nr:TolC family outer membrane protein [Shinella sp.]
MALLRKKTLIAALLPLLFALPQNVAAETIFGAMAKAYEHNPDLNAARAALRAVDENVTIAKAPMRPQIDGVAEADASRTIFDRPIVSGLGSSASRRTDSAGASYGISITQQIFDGFQTANRVRAAEADVLATRESLRANEISILLSAAEAYANIARDQQIVSIRRQNLQFLREQLNAAEARLQVGEGTRTDVSQAEAELAGAQALLASAISQLKQSEAVYVQIVGETPTGIKQPEPATKSMPSGLDQAVAIGMREHPSILAAQRTVDAAGYNVKAAEGAMLPGVSLQGQVSRSTGSGSSDDNVTGSVSARVTIPLYQGGAEYGAIRQAKEQLGESRILVDSARMEVQRTIATAHAQLEAARAAISANRSQIRAANMALEGVIEERNVGQRTTLDVLNAQQTVLDAREALAGTQRDAVVASYSLLAATGRLTVSSQNLKVAEYRAEKHYEAVKDKWFGLRTVDGR